jgi:hypothetical protein
MSNLTEKELAILNGVIYCDVIVTQRYDKYLCDLVADMLKPEYDWSLAVFSGDYGYMESEHSREHAIEEYKKILEEVQKSENLQNIKIINPKLRDGMDITVATFVDTQTNTATVVFRGTDASYKQWNNNFEAAGNDLSTPLHDKAREYMEQIAKLGYSSVTVTGHSQGGNMAAYVTLFNPIIDRCVTFNSQGYSEYFHKAYKNEIAANAGKITAIAGYADVVCLMLFQVTEIIYVNSEGEFPESHYISALVHLNDFDENGNFTTIKEQSFGTQMLKAALDAVVILLPPGMEEYFTDVVGSLASLLLGKDDVTDEDISHALPNIFLGILSVATIVIMPVLGVALLAVVGIALLSALMVIIDWATDGLLEKAAAASVGIWQSLSSAIKALFAGATWEEELENTNAKLEAFTEEFEDKIPGMSKVSIGDIKKVFNEFETIRNELSRNSKADLKNRAEARISSSSTYDGSYFTAAGHGKIEVETDDLKAMKRLAEDLLKEIELQVKVASVARSQAMESTKQYTQSYVRADANAVIESCDRLESSTRRAAEELRIIIRGLTESIKNYIKLEEEFS